MQNQSPTDVGQSLDGGLTRPDDSLASNSLQSTPTAVESTRAPTQPEAAFAVVERKRRLTTVLRTTALVAGGLFVLLGTVFVFLQRNNRPAQIRAGSFGAIQVPLAEYAVTPSAESSSSLKVNGRMHVTGSIVLTPTSQPDNPVSGQLYFDQTANRLVYYDGTQFVFVQGTTVATNITNTTVTGGGGTLNGVQGSIAMFTGSNTLGSSLLNQSGSTVNIATSTGTAVNIGGNGAANTVSIDAGSGSQALQVGNSAGNHGIQIGTGAGVQNVAVGSGSSSSATTIQGGTGGLLVSTGASDGVTGSLTIKTGDSSTTASGNITIDAGSGIIDGEVVGTKTFESGVDNMINWFGSTIAQTTAQAHSGTGSLEMTATAGFWGVQENINNPITPVVPGHNYHFSLWVRAATTPRTITSLANWVGGGGATLNLQVVVDSTTGWTEITGNGIAPAGATGVYPTMQGIGVVGEVHYFDDVVVTDLSSSSAASTISIGETNAKIITIGNINQIGATSIFGGSGINLSSGVSGITLNGGGITLNSSATSSFGTSKGALTLTSAATAIWGISTASSGVGGTLTVRAGGGGTDGNNDGGDIILQGGAKNGTGTAGSVIVKPPTDVTDAFQIQNSTATPLFVADSSGMRITVSGTDTTYARFMLTDAHFQSTQTSAPTIGAPINCGATPTAAITAGSTDSAGSFTITTGTGGTSSTCDTTLTFHSAYGAAPKSILVVGKTDAASAARQIYVSASNATTFTTIFGVGTGGANSTTYNFSYWVIE